MKERNRSRKQERGDAWMNGLVMRPTRRIGKTLYTIFTESTKAIHFGHSEIPFGSTGLSPLAPALFHAPSTACMEAIRLLSW